jgi:hypothetical protein
MVRTVQSGERVDGWRAASVRENTRFSAQMRNCDG